MLDPVLKPSEHCDDDDDDDDQMGMFGHDGHYLQISRSSSR